MSNTYDAIVIGGGHNGLVSAAYLAKAGKKVLVLERYRRAGGCVHTEELIPGYHINLCSLDHVILPATSIPRDLELETRFGLKYLSHDEPAYAVPFPDGQYYLIYKDIEKTCASIAETFSQKDADDYRRFANFWVDGIKLFLPIMGSPLYPLSEAFLNMHPADRVNIFRLALKQPGKLMKLVKTAFKSPRDILDEFFDNDRLKTPFAWTINSFGVPLDREGMGFMSSFLMFCHVSGVKRPEGGSGELCEALVRAIEHHGGTVRVNAIVDKVLMDKGRATGVVLRGGELIQARDAVISSINPKKLFLDLIGEDKLEPGLARQLKHLKAIDSGHFKLDLAVNEKPVFTRCNSDPRVAHASPLISPSVEYTELAHREVLKGELPEHPPLWAAVPTSLDPTMAPPGKHTVYIYAMAPKQLSNGRRWEDVKEQYADHLIDKLAEYAPNIKDNVIARVIETPDDFERRVGDTHSGHLDLTFGQSLAFRPLREMSGCRTPIQGLYVCGSGVHPGGGVSGLSGRNAAHVVLRDLKPRGLVGRVSAYLGLGRDVVRALFS